MDSRLHAQRHRSRGRVSRAFSPAQYVLQQQPQPPPPPPPPYHASPLQHRLSLVEDQFAGIPLEHCDYATLLAYRQRLNGLLPPHPAGLVSVARNQNAVWSQERLQGFHSTENRLATSDDYNRQGSFGRDYRLGRDDLRSLSELDNSRRSAALSAKLFLDDVRPAPPVFPRGTPFESALELNRHRIERQDVSHDLSLAKTSQRNPPKRNREEDADVDRDRATRHRRFHDPGLAVLPRTPEASQDFPFVQRMLSSGRVVESDDHQDNHTISNRTPLSYERLHISPAKSIKKKLLAQRGKMLPSDTRYLSPGNGSRYANRLDGVKDNSSGMNDPKEMRLHTREAHFREQSSRDNKLSTPSPSASHFQKNIDAGSVDDSRLIRFDNAEAFKLHSDCSAARARAKGTLDKDQKLCAQNSKHRLAARSVSSIRKALRAVETTPRSKNAKTRVIRLLGSDAKVCGVSPKSRQDGREGKGEVPSDLQTSKAPASPSCKQGMQKNKQSSQQKESKEVLWAVKIKQEQLALTEVQSQCISTQLQPPSSLHMQCELSAYGGSKAATEDSASVSLNLHQPELERGHALISSEALLPRSRQEEEETYQWDTGTALQSAINSAGIATVPLTRLVSQLHELAQKQHTSVPATPSLNANTNIDDTVRMSMKTSTLAALDSSVSLTSQSFKKVITTAQDGYPTSTDSYDSHGIQNSNGPNSSRMDHVISHSSFFHTLDLDPPVSMKLKLAGDACADDRSVVSEVQKGFLNKVSLSSTEETTAEREVRLFGKSLKAPVAKVSLGTAGSSTPHDLSLDRIQKPVLSTSHLASEQQGTSAGVCNKATGEEVSVQAVSVSSVVSNGGEAMNELDTKGKETTFLPQVNMTTNSALPTASVVLAKQRTMPSLPNNSFEPTSSAVRGVILEPSYSSPILASEQQLDATVLHEEAVGATFDATLNNFAPAKMPISFLASGQHGDMLESQATVVACIGSLEPVNKSNLASGQQARTDAREDFLTKDSLPQNESCQSAGIPKHGGKPEALLTDKSAMYTPSKQVSPATFHPHGRLQSVPGRAVANTWRRSSNSHGLSTSQAVSKTPKFVNKHTPKVLSPKVLESAAYVRKGNSLVRAPISAITAASVPSNTCLLGLGKDLLGKAMTAPRGYPGSRSALKNARSVFKQVSSVQKLPSSEATVRTPHHDKVSAHNLEGSQDGQNIVFSHAGVKVVTSEGQPHSSLRVKTDELSYHLAASEASYSEPKSSVQPRPVLPSVQPLSVVSNTCDCSSTFYVKNKANQLIAASQMKTPPVASTYLGQPDIFSKRNNNQLVRNGSEAEKQALQDQKSREQTHGVWRTTMKKAFRKRAYLPLSRVWTLKDGSSSEVESVIPLLFPWKRTGLGVASCAGRFKALPKAKKGSLLFYISKKLQRSRKIQPVYSRSAGGFSLHRSGLLSLGGANLKWTKSIEKRSKQASEEATKAVAEVEKQQRKENAAVTAAGSAVPAPKAQRRIARDSSRGRERIVSIGLARYKMDPLRRTLQRLPDLWCGTTEASLSKHSSDLAIFTPRRLSFDGTEYVRIGNGHQLVRDPKAASRALANEKVRWSLHTVRSRRAKKQQYCLFFTRFGKCNKSEGECLYIHDPEKIAVCTKFLKGCCLGTNCLFSHKVIPERMPDCSFFLEGLCTNEECPYRHVSVNPNAPICEGFLKGFCSDGNECNKKHTTVCPSFSATGECSDKSTCKLHHPKKSGKRVPSGNLCKLKTKKRRWYFGIDNIKADLKADEMYLDTGSLSSLTDSSSSMEFIEIPDVINKLDEIDDFKRKFSFFKEHLSLFPDGFQEEADMVIKPVLLLQRAVSA